MRVVFTANYSFSERRTLLVIDFINLKIKLVQSFIVTRRCRVFIHIYIGECSYIYKYLCFYCIFKKEEHVGEAVDGGG
jgi:hypothetical protein